MKIKMARKCDSRFKVKKSRWSPGSWTVFDNLTKNEITLASSKKGATRILPQVIKACKRKTLWFSKKYLKGK